MLYIPDENVRTREELRQIRVPIRKDDCKERWMGVQFGFFVDQLTMRAEAAGFTLKNERWTVQAGDTDLLGAMDVYCPENWAGVQSEVDGVCLSITARSSNIGRYPLEIAAGGRHIATQSGIFAGHFVMGKRHSRYLKIEETIDDALLRFTKGWKHVFTFIEALKGVHCSRREGSAYLVDAGRLKIIPNRFLPEVDALWQNPPHEDMIPNTLWALYLTFAYWVRTQTIHRQYQVLRHTAYLLGQEVFFDHLDSNDINRTMHGVVGAGSNSNVFTGLPYL